MAKKSLNLHLKFCTGNIVKWDGDLYIVSDIKDNSLTLLPLDDENVSYHPTATWPCIGDNPRKPDKKRTVQTVKHVADCVQDYMYQMMMSAALNSKRKNKDFYEEEVED
jgi:hypothetical protein